MIFYVSGETFYCYPDLFLGFESSHVNAVSLYDQCKFTEVLHRTGQTGVVLFVSLPVYP